MQNYRRMTPKVTAQLESAFPSCISISDVCDLLTLKYCHVILVIVV